MHNPPIRKLTATWTLDETEAFSVRPAPVDITKLSEDEQADLIIEKLKHPPVGKTIMEALEDRMSSEIADEIDRELLQSLMGDLYSTNE